MFYWYMVFFRLNSDETKGPGTWSKWAMLEIPHNYDLKSPVYFRQILVSIEEQSFGFRCVEGKSVDIDPLADNI